MSRLSRDLLPRCVDNMRILVCGDRNWRDRAAIRRQLVRYDSSTTILIEGEASGADVMSRHIARELNWPDDHILRFPADWERYGRRAGPIRNTQMLKEGKPDEVLAFHTDIRSSKGTKNMISQAKYAGIPVKLIPGSC